MDADELKRTQLAAFGMELVVEDKLPAGTGVLDSEVGEPGPWYGYRFAHGDVWGWARSMELLPWPETVVCDAIGPLTHGTIARRLTEALARAIDERDDALHELSAVREKLAACLRCLLWECGGATPPSAADQELVTIMLKKAAQ